MIFKKQQYEWGMPESGNFRINITMSATDAAPAELTRSCLKYLNPQKLNYLPGWTV